MHLLVFKIYKRDIYPAGSMALSKHVTHYGPWTCFPCYNLTSHSLPQESLPYLPPGDAMSSSVGLIWALGIFTYKSSVFYFTNKSIQIGRGHRGRDHMVVGFTTTYAISAYHHWCCEFESWSGRGVQHYVIKFVSDLRQVCGFLWVLQFPPSIKLTATI
jgi:hypothetical protein